MGSFNNEKAFSGHCAVQLREGSLTALTNTQFANGDGGSGCPPLLRILRIFMTSVLCSTPAT